MPIVAKIEFKKPKPPAIENNDAKLCRECKWSLKDPSGDMRPWNECGSPHLHKTKSVITGEITIHDKSCVAQRNDHGWFEKFINERLDIYRCGPEGRFWEAK